MDRVNELEQLLGTNTHFAALSVMKDSPVVNFILMERVNELEQLLGLKL